MGIGMYHAFSRLVHFQRKAYQNPSLENKTMKKFPCISVWEISLGEFPSRKLDDHHGKLPHTEVQISLGRSALAPLPCVSANLVSTAFGSDKHESPPRKNLARFKSLAFFLSVFSLPWAFLCQIHIFFIHLFCNKIEDLSPFVQHWYLPRSHRGTGFSATLKQRPCSHRCAWESKGPPLPYHVSPRRTKELIKA